MLVLDVEEEKIYTTKVSLRIKESIKGMSQLNVNNNLFLCGSENESTEGAFLFRIDNTKSLNSIVSILINAQHNHVYPSMINLPDNTIIVVGGKKQIQCELFDINNSKWKYLPELPEERYHCSLLLDHNNKYVYLFGGFCSEKGTNCTDILRMNTESLMIWDKLLIVEGKELLAKTMCGMIRKENEDKEGKVVYIAKSYISDIRRNDIESTTSIWNKDSQPTEYVVKETPEEILAMPDIEEGNKVLDWEQRRYEIAKDITAAIYTRPNVKGTFLNYNRIVAAADGLIRELKKGGEKCL